MNVGSTTIDVLASNMQLDIRRGLLMRSPSQPKSK